MAEILTPDLCVIGAGAGGLAVADGGRALAPPWSWSSAAGWAGRRLNTGCVPSKALVAAGCHAHAMRSGAPFGIAADEPRINSRRLHDHVEQVIAAIAPRRRRAAGCEALGVEIVQAEGTIRRPAHAERRRNARSAPAASSSPPAPGRWCPRFPGSRSVPYFTTETIFDNTRKLTHLVIIGAGPIGLELAQAYNRLGTQVTVVEAGRAAAAERPRTGRDRPAPPARRRRRYSRQHRW